MNTKISDALRFAAGVASTDIVTPATSAYITAADARRFAGVLTAKVLADTKTATVQLVQAQDAGGTASKNLGAAVVHVASGAETNVVVVAEAQSSDLDFANGFTFIGVTVSSNNTAACAGGAVLLKGDTRFSP